MRKQHNDLLSPVKYLIDTQLGASVTNTRWLAQSRWNGECTDVRCSTEPQFDPKRQNTVIMGKKALYINEQVPLPPCLKPQCGAEHFWSARQHTHTLICRFQLLNFQTTFLLAVLFLMKSLFLRMPFMDSQTLLTTMFSILMFRIFLVRWLFVFVFFVLILLIRGVETKGRQMLYCCRHAMVISYHPPSGQCSGNEVQRVSQVILHSGGVYVCVYMCIYP